MRPRAYHFQVKLAPVIIEPNEQELIASVTVAIRIGKGIGKYGADFRKRLVSGIVPAHVIDDFKIINVQKRNKQTAILVFRIILTQHIPVIQSGKRIDMAFLF